MNTRTLYETEDKNIIGNKGKKLNKKEVNKIHDYDLSMCYVNKLSSQGEQLVSQQC